MKYGEVGTRLIGWKVSGWEYPLGSCSWPLPLGRPILCIRRVVCPREQLPKKCSAKNVQAIHDEILLKRGVSKRGKRLKI